MKHYISSFNGKSFISKTISINNYSVGKCVDITMIRYFNGKRDYRVSLYRNGNISVVDVCDWKSAKNLAKAWVEG